jgi:hypothetical protein
MKVYLGVYTSIFLLFLATTTQAQYLSVEIQSGSIENYDFKNLKITFDSTSFIFSNDNSIVKKWGYGEVRKIIYSGISVGIDEQTYKQNSLVQIYPQPVQQNATIKFYLPSNDNLVVKIINATGSTMNSQCIGEFQKGEHLLTVGTDYLSTGLYWVCLEGYKFSDCTHLLKIED